MTLDKLKTKAFCFPRPSWQRSAPRFQLPPRWLSEVRRKSALPLSPPSGDGPLLVFRVGFLAAAVVRCTQILLQGRAGARGDVSTCSQVKTKPFLLSSQTGLLIFMAWSAVITELGHQSPSASRCPGMLETPGLGAPGCWLDRKEIN